MNAFSSNMARSIVFGSGTISQIGEIVLRELGPREHPRVAVVTDKGLVASGMTEALTAALKKSGLDIVLIDSVVAAPPRTSSIRRSQNRKTRALISSSGMVAGHPWMSQN